MKITSVLSSRPRLFKFRHQLADVLVHARDHGGEALFGSGPILVSVGTEIGHLHAVAGRHAEFVIGVRNGVGQVEEERIVLASFDEIDGARSEKIVRIHARHAEIARNIELVLVLPKMVRIKCVRVGLVKITEPFVEALQIRDARTSGAAQSPLAEDTGAVAGLLQDFGHRDIGLLQVDIFRVPADAAVADVLARHKGAPRGSADGIAGVNLREAHAFGGEAVDVRCLNALLPETAQVAVAEIVGENENDIGPTGCGLRAERGAGQATEKFSSLHSLP